LTSSQFAAVYGTVFEDNDVDGDWDGGEPGITGVTIALDGTTTTTTNVLGQYTFTVMNTGTYTISEQDPEDYVSTNAIPGHSAVTRFS